jgi:multidrug resistance protein, MATE family
MNTALKPESRLVKPGGYRELWLIAYPLVLSTAGFTINQFVDRIFLGRHSMTEIQAALPAGVMSFTLISGFMALCGYANTFVAQYHGAKDPLSCSRVTAQGIFLALLSWPVMLALIPLGEWILRLSNHPPDILAAELAYFRPLMWGSLAVPLGAAISSFYTGRGDTLTNMIAMLAGNVANIALDYAWIFGHWGFPEWGIAGAAWATVVGGFLSPLLLFLHYFGLPRMRRVFDTWRTFRPDKALTARLLRFGVPSALHYILDISGFTFFVLLLGRLGGVELAASNIAFSINHLSFMPLVGLGIAAATLVGQYQGVGDSDTAAKAGWTAMKAGWLYAIVVGLLFVLLPRPLFLLFAEKGNPASIDPLMPLAFRLMIGVAVWGVLDASNIILAGALKGAGDTRFVMLWSMLMCWGFWITGELVILLRLKAGLMPAWIWLTLYVSLLGVGFLWRFRQGRWKAIQVIDRQIPPLPGHASTDALGIVE